ncbi:MAG: hypothetical protein Q8861_12755 [Bacteroidota bacterium]|nr:hypothetical protein [Bacteroidota bacterium]
MQMLDIPQDWLILKSELLEFENNFDDSLLTEDLFQIRRDDFIIDSGWYQSQNAFITYLILKSSWEEPIVKIRSFNIDECLNAIRLVILYADTLRH